MSAAKRLGLCSAVVLGAAIFTTATAHAHDLRISHIAYDRAHTSAADSGTWFPLQQLRLIAAEKRIGELAPRFFGAPTNRSHRVTIETDAPEILRLCEADQVDADHLHSLLQKLSHRRLRLAVLAIENEKRRADSTAREHGFV